MEMLALDLLTRRAHIRMAFISPYGTNSYKWCARVRVP